MSSTANLEDGYSLPNSLPRIRAPPPSSAPENSTDEAALPEGDAVECRTPTSSDHRIPPQLTCPPAPRKPSSAAKRKRAVSEVPCQKNVRGEEIEAFFRSCEVKKPAGGFRVILISKWTCSCK